MPRELLARRYWERVRIRNRRGGASWAVDTPPPTFFDRYPDIAGTVPEKIILNLLAERQISFFFNVPFGDIPFTTQRENFRPDFILPDYRIIIDVNGYYWHGLPGHYEHDYTRSALLEASGYTVYQLLDIEIVARPYNILDDIPELASAVLKGGRIEVGDNPIDVLAPVRERIRKRPKITRTTVRDASRRRRIRKEVLSSVPAGRKIRHEVDLTNIFTREDWDPAYLAEVLGWGQTWKSWIESGGATEYVAQYTTYVTQLQDYVRDLVNWLNDYSDSFPEELITEYQGYLTDARSQLRQAQDYLEELQKDYPTWQSWWNKFQY